MSDVIMDTGDLSEDADGYTREHMEATEQPTGQRLEFHVQMKSWTMHDMEDLIVQAAAFQIVGRIGKETNIAKQIEQRCLQMLSERIDQALAGVTKEILDQPITPDRAKEPVTMRDFIGLCGREFLSQRVDSDGKPSDHTYSTTPRMERLVRKLLHDGFKTEVETATNAAISEVRKALKAKQDEILTAEKARIRAAVATYTA